MSKQNNTLGVVIITKNEEKNISRCLDSVKWANEIIVVDSGSTDKTIEIAKGYGAKVYHQEWLGFGLQKNKAISYATSRWLLALDADELVSDELKRSILQVIKNNQHEAYKFKRLSQFCGQWIKYGDWGRDIITRLFKRECAQYSSDIVHERLITQNKPQLISGTLLHYSQGSISDSLSKLNSYSDATSTLLLQKGKSTSLFKASLHKHWTFVRSFILRLGFLDGSRGYLIAKLSAYGSYFKYVKLWEKQQNEK
ncbi:glycosyltransferase family 2 protein [Fastidiosibacter lacustris]|uniref:glycosyltransferase family 2 protein n=1 Tax=Fastidiosibacter lacustris TaxID=2056695 RepID=UPI000E343D85|nr:glycosyltransferase family 2 protein [Fastidiosibacter lacustris]